MSSAPAWYYAFNLLRSIDFTDHELTEELKIFRDAHTGWDRIVDRSLKRDVDCIIRMYAADADRTRFREDSIDSPFSELRLMAPTSGDRRHLRFNLGAKDNLPDAVVAYAALDYLTLAGHQASTISLRRLTHDVGSPGRAFKLPESVIRTHLEAHADHQAGLAVTDPAGIGQLIVDGDPELLAAEALDRMYRSDRP